MGEAARKESARQVRYHTQSGENEQQRKTDYEIRDINEVELTGFGG